MCIIDYYNSLWPQPRTCCCSLNYWDCCGRWAQPAPVFVTYPVIPAPEPDNGGCKPPPGWRKPGDLEIA